MTPQLCLGTAQFGLAYGITNAAGQVSEQAVAQLLDQAGNAGIRWLDTAQAYGNAEEVLGRHLPKSHQFQLISKLPAQPQHAFRPQDTKLWEQAYQVSCQHMGVQCLHSLLLHAPGDLHKPGGNICRVGCGPTRRGLVQRIGVSIYTAEDLEG